MTRYRFRTRRMFPGSTIRCLCGRTFGTSRELREHEERCASVRQQRDIDRPSGA